MITLQMENRLSYSFLKPLLLEVEVSSSYSDLTTLGGVATTITLTLYSSFPRAQYNIYLCGCCNGLTYMDSPEIAAWPFGGAQ